MKKVFHNLTREEKILLFLTNLFFLWTSFDFVGWYKIWLGADASQYSFYLKYFIEGPTSIGYEQGVHYFWFLSLLVRPLWLCAVTAYCNFSDAWAYHLGVLLFNTFLFILLLNITFYLFKKLFSSTIISFLALWNFLLLTPIYYSRLLIKPDLLTILLFIIFLYVLLEDKVFNDNSSRSYLYFSLFFGFMLSTKFTVSVVSTFILVSYLFIHKKNEYSYKKIIIFFLISMILAGVLIIHSHSITERYVWETPRAEPNYESAPIEYFTNFSFIDTYKNPLRDNLKGSFSSIWLADFYGDYWEVYFLSKHSSLHSQLDSVAGEDRPTFKMLWARACFLLSFIANFVFVISLIYKIYKRKLKGFDGVVFSLYFLIAPVSLIIIASVLEWFKSSEGDPTKTTYFGFLFIFFILSVFSFLEEFWPKVKSFVWVFTFLLLLTRLPFLFSSPLNVIQTASIIPDPLSSHIEAVVPYFDERCIYTEEEAVEIISSKRQRAFDNPIKIDILTEYFDFSSECSGKVFGSNYLGGEDLEDGKSIILKVSR